MTNDIRTKLRLVVIMIIAIAGVPFAHGQGTSSNKRVRGVLAVGGTAGEADRATVNDAVESALTSAGWLLPQVPLPKDAIEKLLGCKTPAQPWLCVPAVIANEQIVRAMAVSVDPKPATNGSPMVAVTATAISPSKSVFVVLQRPCEQCTPDKLKQASSTLVAQLLKDLASRAGDTAIEVSSNPTNAEVTLDGHKLSATDNTLTTFPGRHTLVIEKAGYEPETRVVDVGDGQTAAVAVEMHAVRRSRALPLGLMVGGAVAVGGGIAIGFDHRDSPNDKHWHQRATAVGIVVGSVGLSAFALGLYLWQEIGSAHTLPKSAPSVATVPGGAVLGWTGAF